MWKWKHMWRWHHNHPPYYIIHEWTWAIKYDFSWYDLNFPGIIKIGLAGPDFTYFIYLFIGVCNYFWNRGINNHALENLRKERNFWRWGPKRVGWEKTTKGWLDWSWWWHMCLSDPITNYRPRVAFPCSFVLHYTRKPNEKHFISSKKFKRKNIRKRTREYSNIFYFGWLHSERDELPTADSNWQNPGLTGVHHSLQR